jgi:hypothetical protein
MGGKWAMILVLLLSAPFVTAPAVQADPQRSLPADEARRIRPHL